MAASGPESDNSPESLTSSRNSRSASFSHHDRDPDDRISAWVDNATRNGDEQHSRPQDPRRLEALDGKATRAETFIYFGDRRSHTSLATIERPFGLQNDRRGAQYSGTRSYDYVKKYPEDQYGEEAFPDARIWKIYLDESEVFDLSKIQTWKDTLDILLVFIGLFSAIVTTFVVQTSQSLQPDYGHLTALMTFEMLSIQRALANGSSLLNITMSPSPSDAFTPYTADAWINGLWFTSLALSLSAALATVLTKQWLHHYMSITSGSSRDRCRIRQFRYDGLIIWRVPLIIDLLPVALHISLVLFLAGLVLFVFPLQKIIAYVVGVITAGIFSLYAISVLLPIIYPQCPYQSPLSSYIHFYYRRISTLAIQARARLRRLLKISTALPQQKTAPPTWEEMEKRAVHASRHQTDADAIVWLHSMTSNSSVQSAAIQAVGGLSPSNIDSTKLCHIVNSTVDYHMQLCIDGTTVRPGSENDFERLLRAALIDTTGRFVRQRVELYFMEGMSANPQLRVLTNLARLLDFDSVNHDVLLVMRQAMDPASEPIILPPSVWRFCLNYIGQLSQQKSHLLPHIPMITSLIRTAMLPTTDVADSTPTNLTLAFQHNFHFQMLAFQTLWFIFGAPISGEPIHLSQLLLRGMDWAVEIWTSYLPHEENSFCYDVPPLLEEVLLQLQLVMTFDWEAEWKLQVGASLSRFTASALALEDDELVNWTILSKLASLIHYTVTPSESTIQAFFLHLSRRLEPSRPDARSAVYSNVHQLVEKSWNLSPADTCGWIQRHDGIQSLLPPPFEGWESILRVDDPGRRLNVSFLFDFPRGTSRPEWVESWIEYLHLPDNLFALCKFALMYDFELDRASYPSGEIPPPILPQLVGIRPEAEQWVECFRNLLGLFDDDDYLRCHSYANLFRVQTFTYNALHYIKDELKVDLSAIDLALPILIYPESKHDYDSDAPNSSIDDMSRPALTPEPESRVLVAPSVYHTTTRWERVKHQAHQVIHASSVKDMQLESGLLFRSISPTSATVGPMEDAQSIHLPP